MEFPKRSPLIVNFVIVYKTVTNIRLHSCKEQFYNMLQAVALLAVLVTVSIEGGYCCNVLDLLSKSICFDVRVY